MKLLITGAAGMLGTDVGIHCEAVGHEVVRLARTDLDVADQLAVERAVESHAPNVVVNCAAYTAVDNCESDHDGAFAGNANAPRNIAIACARSGARLIHISTDYVFDGTKIDAYIETDATNPVSVYGASKLAGEVAVAEVLGDRAAILRTAWVCGEYGNNMVKTVMRLAGGDGPLRFVADQRGCPTFTADLAQAIERFAVLELGGLFHVTNQGPVSWYEFVAEIIEQLGGDRGRVEPIATTDLQPSRPAPRPANSVLENAAMRSAGLPMLDDFRVPLTRLLTKLQR